ncbi:MAG: [LysW]-lysine hydrolase [Anaerolineales bacterium]|nr:[LysW]-lysine hydrolase [Anaerolineales bacterium]
MSDFETLIGLVSQYSPSGQERRAVEWLTRRMQSLGYDETFVDEAGNAVGVMGSGSKQVLLLGHIDTVPGGIEVQQVSGLLYGRGSVDAKGPLACFTDAIAQFGAVTGWQFIVIGAVEEERDSDGARYVATKYKPDYAIIGEPNNWDRVALGYKGSAWANITVRRGQVHSASGEQTACEAAVDVWLAVKSSVDAFNAEKQRAFDKLIPTLRGMDSGQDGFEQWARLNIGVRLPPEISPDDWYEKLQEETLRVFAENLQSEMKEAETLRVLVEPVGFAIPTWAGGKNNPLVRAFLSGIRSQGGEPRFVYKTGTADVNIVAPLWGCPAVVYGPGDSSLDHTPNEHIRLDEYEKSVQVLCNVLKTLIK